MVAQGLEPRGKRARGRTRCLARGTLVDMVVLRLQWRYAYDSISGEHQNLKLVLGPGQPGRISGPLGWRLSVAEAGNEWFQGFRETEVPGSQEGGPNKLDSAPKLGVVCPATPHPSAHHVSPRWPVRLRRKQTGRAIDRSRPSWTPEPGSRRHLLECSEGGRR